MTSSGIHVLVLTSLFPSRPGEKNGNFVLDQVRELAAHGADVTVLVARPWIPNLLKSYCTPDRLPINERLFAPEKFELLNASFFSLPRFALGRHATRFLRALVPVIGYVHARKGIDVIHAHGLQLAHAAVEAAAELRIPSVVTVHGIETATRFDNSRAKRDQIGDSLDRSSKVVLVGSPLFPYVRRFTSKTDHCTVIGNGYNAYPDLTASTQIPRQRQFRVVAVSNYEESKGFEILIDALASLELELRAKFEAVLVGGGAGFDSVGQRVSDRGLADCVHYTGPLLHRDAIAEMLAGDIFCLPSWREAFGIMYAEAMSLGKLTVGCSGQGPADFIRHLDTGYLVEPRNVDSVADALRWAAANPDGVHTVSERGREYANSNLTWSHNAETMLGLYRSLLPRKAVAG